MRQPVGSDAPIPILIAVDIEPEESYIDKHARPAWRGVPLAPHFLAPIRERIAQVTGSTPEFTWLCRLDEQVNQTYGSPDWALVEYGRAIEALRTAGDVIGIHVHPFRWDQTRGAWIQDYGNHEWVRHCTEVAMEMHQRHIGGPVEAFSFGFEWMSNAMFRWLDEHGVQHDLTLVPGLKQEKLGSPLGEITGELQGYEQIPARPYRPAHHDFCVADSKLKTGIVEVPLTIQARSAPRSWSDRLRQTARRLLKRGSQTQRLLLRMGPENFRDTVNYQIATEHQPYFVFAFRTAVFADERLKANVLRSFDFLLNHPAAHRFRFVGPAQLVRLLDGNAAAASGRRVA